MAISHLTKAPQQDLSILIGKIFLSKDVLLMNCQASGLAPSLGLDLWWDSIVPQFPEEQVAIAPELVLDALAQPWEKSKGSRPLPLFSLSSFCPKL